MFTNVSIKALKPKSERYETWEDNGKGFWVRVSSAGAKVGFICIGLTGELDG